MHHVGLTDCLSFAGNMLTLQSATSADVIWRFDPMKTRGHFSFSGHQHLYWMTSIGGHVSEACICEGHSVVKVPASMNPFRSTLH